MDHAATLIHFHVPKKPTCREFSIIVNHCVAQPLTFIGKGYEFVCVFVCVWFFLNSIPKCYLFRFLFPFL